MNETRQRGHRGLVVWQRAMSLAAQIYAVTNSFPRHELFGLTSQLRRAAVSIPSNIAEGAARSTTRDLLSFLHIARGSQAEIETQVLLASTLGYLDDEDRIRLLRCIDETGRLLTATIHSLRRRLLEQTSSRSTIR
jgi:four helix bundle protein